MLPLAVSCSSSFNKKHIAAIFASGKKKFSVKTCFGKLQVSVNGEFSRFVS